MVRSVWCSVALIVIASCSPGEGSVHTSDGGAADAAREDVSAPADQGPFDLGTPPDGAADAIVPPRDLGMDADARDPGPVGPFDLFVGESDGDIRVYRSEDDGRLSELGAHASGGRLTFLSLVGSDLVYSTNESRVEGFRVDASYAFASLGAASSVVAGTHLELVPAGTGPAIVASYGDDTVASVPISAEGVPSGTATLLGAAAGEPDLCRRAHQARIHPGNPRFAYVPCLGSDHVAIFDLAGGIAAIGTGVTPAGAGPRHMDFHPTLDVAYVINERADSITVFSVDDASGALGAVQTVSTLAPGETEIGPASDIHVTPDGRWVFGINRNPRNELVRFSIADDGTLTFVDAVVTPGEHARTFAIRPDGRFLYVGHSNSQDIAIYAVGDDGSVSLVETQGGFDSRVMFTGFR